MTAAGSSYSYLKPGDQCSGFTVIQVTELPALQCAVVLARHEYSGAQLMHVYNPVDEENLFAIAFRTPPRDDTGVPHILEHSVLGGSRKFPVKDPFIEMLKMSMATFINAMTYPDKTVYPVASNVRQDYFNLVDVYCDAVLHPNIDEATLHQEGHRLALADDNGLSSPLVYRGIVYNEMKGAYSDLDSLIDRTAELTLFPDSPYGFDSGGDPAVIPELTYAQFRQFYDRYYHPANSRIFLYGDIPTPEHLAFLDARLTAVPPPPVDLDSTINIQPRWKAPRRHTVRYPIDPTEEIQGKGAVTFNWLCGDITEPIIDLAMEVVDRLLLGNSAAPLRQALVDSQLGTDLTSAGYSNGILETTFHVGLKGTDCDKCDQIEAVIFSTLEKVVAEGFSAERIEAAFHQLQYSHREIQSNYPLRLMDWAYSAWLYDGVDPLTCLRTGQHLERLSELSSRDPEMFTRLIQERLLANPHRATILFEPDPGLEARREAELSFKLADLKARMTEGDLIRLQAENAELERRQSAPNPPEAVATLPHLKITDIPPVPPVIPAVIENWTDDITLVRTELPSNGINYLMLAFDLTGMPSALLPYVPIFCQLLTRCGAAGLSYAQIAEEIAGNTDGIKASTFVGCNALDPNRLMSYITISLKSLDGTYGKALEVVRKLLLELELDDHARLRDVLRQTRERFLSSIVPSGHKLAASHAARTFSPVAALAELWGGVPQIRLSCRLGANPDAEIGALKQKIHEIRRFILRRPALKMAFTGTPEQIDITRDWTHSMIGDFPISPAFANSDDGLRETAAEPLREGLAFMADVAFCATCFPAPAADDPAAPALQILSHLLSFEYLWEEVRAKGGAYGGFSSYNASSQVFELLSYRDPHIERTLQVYDRTRDHLAGKLWTQQDIEQAIIACAKHDQTPIRPGWATAAALWRYLGNLSEPLRNQRRQALLQQTPATVKQAALGLFDQAYPRANKCVLSSRQKLQTANPNLPEPLAIEDLRS